MLIDASLFMNEVDLLELRLRSTAGIVDRFLILEARETTRGVPRDLVFPQIQDRLRPWRDLIDYHVVGMPPADHPHTRFQRFRNLINDFLPDGAPNDLVLISDADEITKPEFLAAAKVSYLAAPCSVGQRTFYYWLNLRFRPFKPGAAPPGWHGETADGWAEWRGPALVRRSDLDLRTPNDYRERIFLPIVPDAGWHFSFMMEPEAMAAKLRAQGHIEYDDERKWALDNLQAARTEGRDWDFGRDLALDWVPLDESYPPAVLQDIERWARYVGPHGRLDDAGCAAAAAERESSS